MFIFGGTFSLFFSIFYFLLVFSIILVVILDNRNPVKTMAWILFLMFVPFIGIIIYFFFGRSNRKQRLISRRGYMRLSKRPMAEFQQQTVAHHVNSKFRIMKFFSNVNDALTFDGNHVDIFTDGPSMLYDMIREITQAKDHIHVQFYIFKDDPTGRLLRDLLIDRARQGVKVRVLYDDVGCWKVKREFFEQMMCEGIEAHAFLKVRFPQFTSKVNYRNHRKIVVIDGRVGYIGGMNIAQRYMRGVPWGAWRDTQVKITGRSVYGLQTAFLTDWYAIDRTLLTSAEYFPKMPVCGDSVAQIVTSDPVGEWRDIMQGIMMIITNAKHYLYMQSPYLLPTEPVLVALQTAALSGVDVRIMIPKKADTRFIHEGSLSYINDMLKAGVKIYMYRKGFIHSKLLVSDDEIASVGSTNMDFRSFEHNFEANAFFYDVKTAVRFKHIFINDEKDCMCLTGKVWSRRSWKNKLVESVVRMFAPLF